MKGADIMKTYIETLLLESIEEGILKDRMDCIQFLCGCYELEGSIPLKAIKLVNELHYNGLIKD